MAHADLKNPDTLTSETGPDFRPEKPLAVQLAAVMLAGAIGLAVVIWGAGVWGHWAGWLGAGAVAVGFVIGGVWLSNRLVDQARPARPAEPAHQSQPPPLPVTRQSHSPAALPVPVQDDLPPFLWTATHLAQLVSAVQQSSPTPIEGLAVHSKVKLVAVNNSLAQMFGYAPAELADSSLLELVAPDFRSAVLRNIMTKYEQPYEIIGLKKNGNTLPVKLHSSIFSFESRPVRVLTVQPAHGRSQADMLAALQDANRELELKFKESTAELRTTNERLYQELNERRRKEAELLQRNRELTTLQAAAVAITSSLDLRFVLDTVVQEMVKLLEVESCTLSEWNQPAQTLTRLARYSLAGWADPTQLGVPLRLADYPLTDTVLEEQIPEQMTISQPHIDPNEAAYMQQTGLKSRLLIPMLFQRRVIGLAELADSRTERTFTHQEISQVRLLANQAANAIENARLYQQAQQEIVERKLAEAALEQERAMLTERVKERTAELSKANAELARASRLKDEFLASMSHELRTPLNAILGSAEILQAKIFGELTDKQQKYSHNIEESGRHLLALINDILDLSKIEAGKMDLEIRPISVKEVCEASIRLIKQLAHKKKLKLTHTIDETVVTILADERRLKQVLVNLLSNAIKFTPEEGQVGLEITGNPDRELVNFTVWDTGIGISREDMARLFQPFVQLDSSLARQYTGTGLGLSLVARMAEMHGGGVSLESEPGHGSRFTVSLPWPGAVAPTAHIDMPGETTQPEIAAAPAAAASPAQPPLILLAEDNEDTINTLTDYLQNQGYNLVIARNGKEAIERLHEDRPHLILMDVQMPGMDGLEATRRIRAEADPTLAGTPIIIITALAMPGDQERCLESGADDYLSKPLSLRGLVKTIEAHRTRP